jgi:hypothetical protein
VDTGVWYASGRELSKRLEAHMIDPVSSLMGEHMGLDVVTREFTAGYGVADLVGAVMSESSCQDRKRLGVATPLDHRYLIEVILALKSRPNRPVPYITKRVSCSESTLRGKVLPRLRSAGFIERDANDCVSLVVEPPKPTERIVAVEVKQTKWREALLQARRYTFFAEQTYVAVWSEITARVDRKLLRKHRIGLISVGAEQAHVVLEAPKRLAREPRMNHYCAEYLYRKAMCL